MVWGWGTPSPGHQLAASAGSCVSVGPEASPGSQGLGSGAGLGEQLKIHKLHQDMRNFI